MRDKLRFSASVLCLLATAILLTIYLAWLLYPMEISYFNLPDKVYLKAETIQYNFNILMNYLTNPFSQKLAMPDFRSSAAGLHHFIKKVVKKGFLGLYRLAFLVISLLPLVFAGLAFMIGFNNFFTLFHQVLFAGDNTWMFDPTKDPVIWILPEEFFMHAFILFALLYEGIFLTLYFLSRKSKEQT